MVWLPRNLPEPGRSSLLNRSRRRRRQQKPAQADRSSKPASHGHRTHQVRAQPGTGQPPGRKLQLKATKKPSRAGQRINAESRRPAPRASPRLPPPGHRPRRLPHARAQLRMSTPDAVFVLLDGVGDVDSPGHPADTLKVGSALVACREQRHLAGDRMLPMIAECNTTPGGGESASFAEVASSSAAWNPLAARRPRLELYIRWMQEIRRFKPSRMSRRFSVAAGFYRTCFIDGVLENSPAEYVRRPSVPAESPTPGFIHLQFEALLTAARQSAHPCDFALVAMLGLLGLRIFEATGAGSRHRSSLPSSRVPAAPHLARTLNSRDRRHQAERSGIGSASAARHSGASKGSAKYWVSWATRPPENSMMLTECEGTPS